VKFISLFTGIGGFDLGFERAGMQCVAQVEFDKRAREVLRKHWPDVALHEDVRNVGKHNLPTVDLVCGGFPCQDLSVAGKRKGLDGERSGLWFEFHRIIGELKPGWVVIENVPGLLTSNRGRDFAVILDGLVKCGYRVAWRVLDAQYFGLAQRRKRVFIVASLGNGRAAEVLFERESGNGNTPPRRATPEADTAAVINCAQDESGIDTDIIALTGWDQQGRSIYSPYGVSPTLTSGGKHPAGGQMINVMIDTPLTVRRLTPRECERLQGFPDDWTAGQPDSARYKQCGNAVAVPVLEWIGKRIVSAATEAAA